MMMMCELMVIALFAVGGVEHQERNQTATFYELFRFIFVVKLDSKCRKKCVAYRRKRIHFPESWEVFHYRLLYDRKSC